MLSPKDLEYFIEIAECQNLSRASERLGLAQPSLSHCIKKIETSLDVELFVRSKTGVSLTQAGKQLFSHCKEMQQYWSDIRAKIHKSHTEISGAYTLGCHPSVALNHISEALYKIIAEHTMLELTIIYDISRKITEKVINRDIDIGVVVNPIRHPDLVIIRLKEDVIGVWHNLTLNELNNAPQAMICDPELNQTVYILKKLKTLSNKVFINRIISSKNLELNAKLALNKAGLAILPESLALITSKKLQLLAESPLFEDEICIVFRPEAKKNRAIQEIINMLKEHVIQHDRKC